MTDGRYLQIFRDGRRSFGPKPLLLPPGAQGNYVTLRAMASIVREDAAFPDLGNFVRRYLIGPDIRDIESQITAAYEFCRDRISYLPEGSDTETVADLWSCLFGIDPDKAVGDCAIKSVALATCLCYLKWPDGRNLRPFFVAIRQTPGVDWFDHVFVGIRRGPRDWEGLDATPPEFTPGELLPSFQQLSYPIFGNEI